jgi:uncharacterized protein
MDSGQRYGDDRADAALMRHPTMQRAPTLADLRRNAVTHTLFPSTTLMPAIQRLGFVQADPIRAPARAQDLTLRHRVRDYRAGDLERRYPHLELEEDYFVNHGFLPRATQRLMHPRTPRTVWNAARWRQAHEVLAFVRERGTVHPREVDAHFDHGRVRNWFGGSTSATTQLLDGMHYRGLLRIAERASGVRMYAAGQAHDPPSNPHAVIDSLVDTVVGLYAPLPERSLGELVSRLGGGVPQWRAQRTHSLARAKRRLPNVFVDGTRWYAPHDAAVVSSRHDVDDTVRLLAPFDPVVWDRRRFELLWGWSYRFEAYVPAPKRVRGYYALPLLWRDRVIGWGNLAVVDGRLVPNLGYVDGKPPTESAFARALDDELTRMSRFLGL